MKLKQDNSLNEKSIGERFSEVIATISEYSYPSFTKDFKTNIYNDLDSYLNSKEFGMFWHGCLGNILSNWYFYRPDHEPELLRFHKHPLCSLNPSWADNFSLVSERSGSDCFHWDPVNEVERKERQDWIDESLCSESKDELSIFIANNLLKTGNIWWSEKEKKAGWIFVEFGELLLYSFEMNFLKSISQFPTFTQLLDEDHGILFKHADEAWDQVKKIYAQDNDRKKIFEEIASEWLKVILAKSKEYESWRYKREKDWFIIGKDSLNFVSGPRDWAIGICKNTIYTKPEESLFNFKKRCRFSPTAEAKHKTRNLVIFPLWVDESFSEYKKQKQDSKGSHSDRMPVLTSPFTAYFVSTFYESEFLKHDANSRYIRALLSTMAYPDILRFTGEAVALSQEVENMRYYGRGLSHDLKPRITIIDDLIKRIENITPSESDVTQLIKTLKLNFYAINKIENDWSDFSYNQNIVDDLKPKNVSLKKLVEHAVEFVKQTDLQINDTINDQLLIIVDYDRMLRVIINILQNAIESMDNKTDNFRIDITASQQANIVYLDISDVGQGIPPEKWLSVFEPEVSQTGGKNRGIGLTLSRLIVNAHKTRLGVGSIYIKESYVEHGTTVRFELPRHRIVKTRSK